MAATRVAGFPQNEAKNTRIITKGLDLHKVMN